ncbi:hypothetical protein PBCV1_a650L [Paramecium bursaria Chlorella virus 1]|uniref:Uncharacterized protein n=1 Tax=Paramecium bursaria Chlorella virus 1 TaxID=10506 RepID=O41132_PBCV1|nr:hypothetical protein PBCV1_a650L [Paramecium bursaria Chlorella virus 1]AAC97036.1 hypothetical protein [Paramecium bursaria Chlorella virus 1]
MKIYFRRSVSPFLQHLRHDLQILLFLRGICISHWSQLHNSLTLLHRISFRSFCGLGGSLFSSRPPVPSQTLVELLQRLFLMTSLHRL